MPILPPPRQSDLAATPAAATVAERPQIGLARLPIDIRLKVYSQLDDASFVSTVKAHENRLRGDGLADSYAVLRRDTRDENSLPPFFCIDQAVPCASPTPNFSFAEAAVWDADQQARPKTWASAFIGHHIAGRNMMKSVSDAQHFEPINFNPTGRSLLGEWKEGSFAHLSFPMNPQVAKQQLGVMSLGTDVLTWTPMAVFGPSNLTERKGVWAQLYALNPFLNTKDPSRFISTDAKMHQQFSQPLYFPDGQHLLVECLPPPCSYSLATTWALFHADSGLPLAITTSPRSLTTSQALFSSDGQRVLLCERHDTRERGAIPQNLFSWSRLAPDQGFVQASTADSNSVLVRANDTRKANQAVLDKLLMDLFPKRIIKTYTSPTLRVACLSDLESGAVWAVELGAPAARPKLLLQRQLFESEKRSSDGKFSDEYLAINFSRNDSHVGIALQMPDGIIRVLSASASNQFASVNILAYIRAHNLRYRNPRVIPSPDGVRALVKLPKSDYRDAAISLLIDLRQQEPDFMTV